MRSKGPSAKKSSSNLNRRSFVKLLPAIGAAAASTYAEESIVEAAQAQPPAGRVTKEMLRAAEQMFGLDFTDAQEASVLGRVNGALSNFQALRNLDVPLDTPLATDFHPARMGRKYSTRRRRLELSQVRVPPFKSVEDCAFFTLTQLAELVRTRRVSSMDLTKMYLARLKKYGPKLLCVVTLTEDLALKQAAQADREMAHGKYRGPLHGIPCGVKDLFATKGYPTQWGAEPFKGQMIDYDATVVERLREAGAVLCAKLSMGALALGGRWFAGMTRCPWQPEETQTGSSGSSAGSGSATAAGLVGFAIGTETLGSIISPSSRNGCVGLRPTYGRISRYGAMALSWTMDKIGPICRGVEDCAAVLHALYGPDGRDISVGEAAFNWDPDRDLSMMRIGYLKSEFDSMTGERKAMYDEALAALKSAGAKLQPIAMPTFAAGNLLIILNAEAATAFDDITRNGKVDEINLSPWPSTFRSARFVPAVEYLRAQRARTLLMREMDTLMQKWDVFVSPAPGSASLTITNLTGHPQVCLKCGFLNNLPQSIMFTSNLYDEAAALRVALAFERETRWRLMHPPMEFA